MSTEKQDALKGLGSTVIRTPTPYAFDHADSHIGIAIKLTKTLDRCICLDQYKNPSNPMAHYEGTGQEIWDQCEGKLDYLFLGAGTGGTLTGISRKLKEMNPNIKIIAIDPEGSLLAQPESMNGPGPEFGQQIEGIGYDFIPRVLDRTLVDEWIKGPDKEAYLMARRLMRQEGFMCGGSSGTAMHACVEYIKKHKIGKGKRCVVLLPDNIRNYMTKHLNDDWMYERGYITEEQCQKNSTSDLIPNNDWGQNLTVNDLALPEAKFLTMTMKLSEALDLFHSSGFAQYPVKNDDGRIMGIITKSELMTQLIKQRVTGADPVSKLVKAYSLRHVSGSISLDEMGRILARNSFALVDEKKFITTSDLLKKVSPSSAKPAAASSEPAKAAVASESSSDGSLFKMAAAAVVGMGVAALGTFLVMNKK